jgi:hypothetical protein
MMQRDRATLFRTKKGHRAKIGDFESEFLERLIRLKICRPGLFDPELDILESYSLFQSLTAQRVYHGGSEESSRTGYHRIEQQVEEV